jgi:hypothetical protein
MRLIRQGARGAPLWIKKCIAECYRCREHRLCCGALRLSKSFVATQYFLDDAERVLDFSHERHRMLRVVG